MKKLLLIFIFLISASFLFAQDEQEGMDESMKAWMDFMTPGEMHEMLAGGAGEWKTQTTFWMYPGAEPQVSEGTAKGEMILGGRYLRTDHSGNAMGMPFEGISIEGYDKALNKFVNIWIDNMGSGIAYAEGVYDKEKNMIEYTGTMSDPMAKAPVKFRETIEWEGDNKAILKIYSPFEGSEFQSMEVVLTK